MLFLSTTDVKYVWLSAILVKEKVVGPKPTKAYFAIKEMPAVVAPFFLFDNVTVFTSCKQGGTKCEHYLVVSIH